MESKIITFYSYKGGVGRSMALANCAWNFASMGKKVLVIDWDLEAPGLPNFFDLNNVSEEAGLIDLFYLQNEVFKNQGLTNTEKQELADKTVDLLAESRKKRTSKDSVKESIEAERLKLARSSSDVVSSVNIIEVKKFEKGSIDMITSGRRKAISKQITESDGWDYTDKINNFNWNDFYDHSDGYRFFEEFKRYLKEELKYDLILIDSRTGVSDSGGICTLQMPDAIAMIFILNRQNIKGTKLVIERIKEKYKKHHKNKEPIIFAQASRVDLQGSDRTKLGYWTQEAVASLNEYLFEDPNSPNNTEEFKSLVFPYMTDYNFGESIAIAEQSKPLDILGQSMKNFSERIYRRLYVGVAVKPTYYRAEETDNYRYLKTLNHLMMIASSVLGVWFLLRWLLYQDIGLLHFQIASVAFACTLIADYLIRYVHQTNPANLRKKISQLSRDENRFFIEKRSTYFVPLFLVLAVLIGLVITASRSDNKLRNLRTINSNLQDTIRLTEDSVRASFREILAESKITFTDTLSYERLNLLSIGLLTDKNDSISMMKDELISKNDQLANEKSKYSSLRARLTSTEIDRDNVKDRLGDLESRLNRLISDSTRLANQVANLDSTNIILSDERNALQSQRRRDSLNLLAQERFVEECDFENDSLITATRAAIRQKDRAISDLNRMDRQYDNCVTESDKLRDNTVYVFDAFVKYSQNDVLKEKVLQLTTGSRDYTIKSFALFKEAYLESKDNVWNDDIFIVKLETDKYAVVLDAFGKDPSRERLEEEMDRLRNLELPFVNGKEFSIVQF